MTDRQKESELLDEDRGGAKKVFTLFEKVYVRIEMFIVVEDEDD